MKYDPEYNSYKFDINEIVNIVNSLNFYSRYYPLDSRSAEIIKNLLSEFNKLKDIPIN